MGYEEISTLFLTISNSFKFSSIWWCRETCALNKYPLLFVFVDDVVVVFVVDGTAVLDAGIAVVGKITGGDWLYIFYPVQVIAGSHEYVFMLMILTIKMK